MSMRKLLWVAFLLLIGAVGCSEEDPPTLKVEFYDTPGCPAEKHGFIFLSDLDGKLIGNKTWHAGDEVEFELPDDGYRDFSLTLVQAFADSAAISTFYSGVDKDGSQFAIILTHCVEPQGSTTLDFVNVPAHEGYLVASTGVNSTGQVLQTPFSQVLKPNRDDVFVRLDRADEQPLGIWKTGMRLGDRDTVDFSEAEAMIPASVALGPGMVDVGYSFHVLGDSPYFSRTMVDSWAAAGPAPETIGLHLPAGDLPSTWLWLTCMDQEDPNLEFGLYYYDGIPAYYEQPACTIEIQRGEVDDILVSGTGTGTRNQVYTTWQQEGHSSYSWICSKSEPFSNYHHALPELPKAVTDHFPGLDRAAFVLQSAGIREENADKSSEYIKRYVTDAARQARWKPGKEQAPELETPWR